VNRNAALEAKVTVAGFRQVTDFWQQQEVTDSDGRKQVRYAAYIVYACAPDVWDKLVATYLIGSYATALTDRSSFAACRSRQSNRYCPAVKNGGAVVREMRDSPDNERGTYPV
jgi:hypothetical protein